MVARYGDFVRLRPPFNAVTALLWLSPVLAVAAGAGAGRAGPAPARPPAAPLSEAERARLAELTRP